MENEFYTNSRGFKVPADKVSDNDKAQDALVLDLVQQAKQHSAAHDEFKRSVFTRVNDFIADMAHSYNVEIGGKKGNITLTSFDGRSRIKVGVADDVNFGPEIIVAKELINNVVNEMLDHVGDDAQLIKDIVQDAFETNKEGQYSKAKIMNLRSKYRYSHDSDEWAEAMKAIDDAFIFSSTKTYVLFHERNELGKWIQIPLVSKSL
ncbi:DUF3164 family protein [Pseudoalteromonas phenolica]|uniref:DUF3164 family protein n=1 Tax=Pseudoalteromonas phenolica TaxID=161398 RepID=UPI000C09FB3D|nr:DUF3164 family protein [Pseudoalteromonas phenolica]MAD90288.1 hypothetical protein [Pseudoalteromonas sp.]TMO54122.1 hypothetical protein CWC21_16690 [Pseudoalteromonas phenolica]|tara:strand:- start:1461 stop:2078 length:618 start_codon:yes stop_codon:yes gene_type:complete